MGGAQRIAVGAVSPSISVKFRDGSGQPVTAGTVTLSVVDWKGAAVTTGAVVNGGDGTYTAPIAAALTAPTQLTATWAASGSSAVSKVDVVGSRLVWPDEFLNVPGLSLSNRSTQEVLDAITWFEDLAYRYMGWSPIVRFRQPLLNIQNGNADIYGSGRFILPDPYVIQVLGLTWHSPTMADITATTQQLGLFELSDGGTLWGPYIARAASVAYLHGNADAGADLHDAAIAAVTLHLQENSAGRPTISVRDELGVTRFSTAGGGRPTGLPDVDAVLNGLRFPAVA